MNGIVGIDPERKAWETFGVPSIPHTVLIAKDGHIVGSTLPDNITSEILHRVLSGQNAVLAPHEGVESDLEWDEHLIEWQDGISPTMYAIIKPIKAATSGIWPRPNHITADGVPLQVLVQTAYETDSYHMDWQMPLDERMFRAAFRVPEERKDRLLPYMRQTLAELFGFEAKWADEEREVFVLRRSGPAALPESTADKELSEMRRGRITLRRQPVDRLCAMLANSFHAPVLNETGLNGSYDFDIPYQPRQPEVTGQALKAIGLEAVKERRTIRMLAVRPEQSHQP